MIVGFDPCGKRVFVRQNGHASECSAMGKVWVVSELFRLTCYGAESIPGHLNATAVVLDDRKSCERMLRQMVTNRVRENYYGMSYSDSDIRTEVRKTLSRPESSSVGVRMYRYTGSDREIVWTVYKTEVLSVNGQKG